MDNFDRTFLRTHAHSLTRSLAGHFARVVANKETLLASVRIVLVAASYIGAMIAADQGQVIAPRPFFYSLGGFAFLELVPALIVVDRRLEFVGLHRAVQRVARIVCTYLFLPLRVGMWLSPIVSAIVSPTLLLITVPMLMWGEWLIRELGQAPGRD